MQSRFVRALGCLVGLGVALAGCSASTGPDDVPSGDEYVISGTVQNNSGAPIPADARVLVVWALPDDSLPYSHVFGEGAIDPEDGSFEVILEDAPPVDALYVPGTLGVGVVVATTDQSVSVGDDVFGGSEPNLVGAAEDHAVIYKSDSSDLEGAPSWADGFGAGYGVGVGSPSEGSSEIFVPAGADGIVLTLDDLDNLTFVNWG